MSPLSGIAGATRLPSATSPLSTEHRVNRGPAGNGMDLKRSTRAQQTWDLVSGNLALPDRSSSALE